MASGCETAYSLHGVFCFRHFPVLHHLNGRMGTAGKLEQEQKKETGSPRHRNRRDQSQESCSHIPINNSIYIVQKASHTAQEDANRFLCVDTYLIRQPYPLLHRAWVALGDQGRQTTRKAASQRPFVFFYARFGQLIAKLMITALMRHRLPG